MPTPRPHLSVRTVVAACLAAAAVALVCALWLGSRSTQTPEFVSWTASPRGAGELPELVVGDSAGPATCWRPLEGGSVQLQVASGSSPEPEVESVTQRAGTLTVTLRHKEGPATLDLGAHEFVLAPEGGEPEFFVEAVRLVRDGQAEDVPAGDVAGQAEAQGAGGLG